MMVLGPLLVHLYRPSSLQFVTTNWALLQELAFDRLDLLVLSNRTFRKAE